MDDRPEHQHSEASLQVVFNPTERVRFIEWGHYSGAKISVGVVTLLAVLTFITGLSTLSQEEFMLDGPLAALIPAGESMIQFGGVLGAFVLGVIAIGLQRRKRLAWYSAFFVIPVIGLLPLFTLQSTHMPVLALVMVSIPLLIFNRVQFREALDLQPLQIAAFLAVIGVLSYGAVGSFALRDQFIGIESLSDALYFVLVTIATVGYGDITPITPEAKWFSLSVIILGVGAFTAAIGALIVPAIEKRMASAFGNMTRANLSLLEDHVVVLGYSAITDGVLDELGDDADVVVVTDSTEVATDLDRRDVNVLTADPTKTGPLRDAGVEFAKGVVIGTDDDPRDVLAVLATRKIAPEVHIVAAATEPHNVEALRDVGADQVISPTEIGGRLLGRSVLNPKDTKQVLADLPTPDEEEAVPDR